jgi:outer membrane lipoprotein-sorting protein
MKKIIILSLAILTLVCGCGKTNKETVIKKFASDVNGSKSYKLTGKMEITNDEDTFKYDLEAIYLKDNNYKVTLVNQTNNHEQIILRNKEGVYVITPSLNKSYKFDSVWPDNSSQSYLLKPILNDLQKDEKSEYTEEKDYYVVKSSVNYPNNTELTYQKVYFNKNKVIDHVEVYNKDNNVKIKVNFSGVNLKFNAKEDDFKLDEYIKKDDGNECSDEDCANKSGAIENIIYPLYIPANTFLSGTDKVNNETTNRVILTFKGDKDFVLVEEKSTPSAVFETIPIYGDPLILNDTIAALSTNSMSWTNDGMSYYLVSNKLSTNELVSVASSLGNNTLVSSSK